MALNTSIGSFTNSLRQRFSTGCNKGSNVFVSLNRSYNGDVELLSWEFQIFQVMQCFECVEKIHSVEDSSHLMPFY